MCPQQLLDELQAETQGLTERSELDFCWHPATALPPLYTDSGKLKIVLKNLISNATKFTSAGSVTIRAEQINEGLTVSILETGIGIPQVDQERIFEPFHQIPHPQTGYETGSGLGLHIVKRLLDLLSGTISVESTVGQGSKFPVWVPFQAASERQH